jgi:Fur family ferric uptake transcriptional regulator
LLFDLINKSHVHLNADQLYELAKKRDARINRVTVYRTLKILKQEGLIDELDLLHHEGDQHYYETRLKREHAHIVCLRCGSVREYFGEPLRMLKDQIESDFGFQIAVARTEVGGYCADCQASAELEKQDAESVPTPARHEPESLPRVRAAR